MAKRRKRSNPPLDKDKGTGNRRSVSPQAAVHIRMKPKKEYMRLPADELERRFGNLPSGKVKYKAKAYNKSLTTGGSGDPTKGKRKKRYSA